MFHKNPKLPTIFLFVVFILFLNSCVRRQILPPENVQTGLASWYGPNFHGKPTSSQEIYDMYDMTAAHRSLPFGTQVMVTNMKNGKSVIVRINDRGPFIKGRIIDLSYAAAQMLDMTGEGVVPVKIEVLWNVSPEKTEQNFFVQVGAFVHKDNALALKKKLENTYSAVFVFVSIFKTSNQSYYRVRIKAPNRKRAQEIARKLMKEGHKVFIIEANS